MRGHQLQQSMNAFLSRTEDALKGSNQTWSSEVCSGYEKKMQPSVASGFAAAILLATRAPWTSTRNMLIYLLRMQGSVSDKHVSYLVPDGQHRLAMEWPAKIQALT